MAFGELIGAAVGILLLIIVAYLVVGSTLSTAEIITNTQKEVTQQNEARLNTDIRISDAKYCSTEALYLNVTNTGNEIIGDFANMDVYVTNPTTAPAYYSYNPVSGLDSAKTWTYSKITLTDGSVSSIHLKQLDPGEVMWVQIGVPFAPAPISGSEVMVVTANGIKSSAMIDIL